MGASVTMARGAAEAGAHPVVGVIGDGDIYAYRNSGAGRYDLSREQGNSHDS